MVHSKNERLLVEFCSLSKLVFGFPVAPCTDADGDGFDPNISQVCNVYDSNDCNDADNTMYPGAPEIFGDGIDQHKR